MYMWNGLVATVEVHIPTYKLRSKGGMWVTGRLNTVKKYPSFSLFRGELFKTRKNFEDGNQEHFRTQNVFFF